MSDKEIILSTRKINESTPPFIIAEIGNNHNGDINIAKELIKVAKECEVDAVKFQSKDVDSMPKELRDKPYEHENSFGKTYREHKEFLELSSKELKELKNYSEKLGLIFFSTPFDIKSADMLEKLGQEIYKISSFHLNDIELIEHVCSFKKPIIISTGMSTIEEITKSVNLLKKNKAKFILLQCTSSYPCDPKDINLKVIEEYRKKFDCLVGYSGHETTANIAPSTVLLGSCCIERHFTLDRSMKGPDHASSLEPDGMRILVKRSKLLFEAMGNPQKQVLSSELKNRKKFRGY